MLHGTAAVLFTVCGVANEPDRSLQESPEHRIPHPASRIAKAVHLALGRDGSDNDKHYASAQYMGLANDSFNPIILHVNLHHGYYGNSSAYSDTSEELGHYLACAINANMAKLLDEAVKLAAHDAEQAHLNAVDEAQSILRETQQ